MNRPIVYHTIALILGILFGYVVRDILLVLMGVFLMASIALFLKRQCSIPPFILWGCVVFFSLGSLLFSFQDRHYERQFKAFEGEQIQGIGRMTSPPQIRDNQIRLVVKTEEITAEDPLTKEFKRTQTKGKVLLVFPVTDENLTLSYGDKIAFQGRLQKPLGKRNPGGFDYKLYLKAKGMVAQVYSTQEKVQLTDENKGNVLVKSGIVVRNRVVQIVEDYLPPQGAGLLNGILLGQTEGLSYEEREAFRRAGLSHIMAVSGMHVGFLWIQFQFLFGFIPINKRYANAFIILLLWGFVLVTGFQPSVLRAVLMATVILLGRILRREPDVFAGISFAAMMLLLLNPYQIFQVGFLLSFSATLGIVMFHQKIKNKILDWKIPDLFKDIFSLTLSAQIGIFPIMARFFNSIPIFSILTNLVVFPVIGMIHFVGMGMVLLGALNLTITHAIAAFEHLLLTFVFLVTKFFSEIDFGVLIVKTPSLFVILCYVLFLLMSYHLPQVLKKYRKAILGIGMIFVLIMMLENLFFQPLEVVFLDVGQGDSAFVRTPEGKTLLIDGGGYASNRTSDMGKTVIEPFFHHRGIRKVDVMISTHADSDHLLGLLTIFKQFPVKHITIPAVGDGYEVLYDLLEKRGKEVTKLSQGDIISLGKNTWIEVLHPQKDGGLQEGKNNNSIAFKLHMKEVSFLFTGDIYKEAEQKMLENEGDLASSVLKVAHHGSNTSTSEAFLRGVSPQVAVISAGRNNRYGHPTEAVLERLHQQDIKIYRTDTDGAVIIKTRGKHLRVAKMLEGSI
jgi:competence protein ComEC